MSLFLKPKDERSAYGICELRALKASLCSFPAVLALIYYDNTVVHDGIDAQRTAEPYVYVGVAAAALSGRS